MKVCLSTPNAYYRIGLTATPGKYGEVERGLLEGATGGIIYEIPLSQLIKDGFVAQPKVEIYVFNHSNNGWDDWRDAEKQGIIQNIKRCQFIADIVNFYKSRGETILVVCDKIEHAKNLLEFLPDSLYLDGQSSSKLRKEYVEQFESKENLVLITTLFKEGVDLRFQNIVIASSSKKERTTIQKSARVLTAGKEFGRIIDIYDKDNSILERHSKARIRTYKKQQFPITYKREI